MAAHPGIGGVITRCHILPKNGFCFIHVVTYDRHISLNVTLWLHDLDGARVAGRQRSNISEILVPGSLVACSEVLKQLLRATDKFVVRDAILRLAGSQR